jgi:hypothetical protein
MRQSYLLLIVMFAVFATANAGDLHVVGPVEGIWHSGTDVFVDGPAYIPAGKSLEIQPGVDIDFTTAEPFYVHGRIQAEGSFDAPIYITAVENWDGFVFEDNINPQDFRFVRIADASQLPTRIITARNANVGVFDCNFFARVNCLLIYGGKFQAENNIFKTTGLFSKTVSLQFLDANSLDPCAEAEANHFRNNIISAFVTGEGEPYPPANEATCGLYVEGSQSLCLTGNTVTVYCPNDAIGMYFSRQQSGGLTGWKLDYAIVTVRSVNGLPQGILAANQGHLDIQRCVVDVGSIASPFASICICASQLASVSVNSCAVQLDRGSYYFWGYSGALLSVDYANQWRTTSSTSLDSVLLPGFDPQFDTQNVIYGSHMFFANPQFILQGNWGEWQTTQEVMEYYGLLPTSPCIDAGDLLTVGYDPDQTLPDIGRFYYAHSPYPDDVSPSAGLVNELEIGNPYPNPFNATSVIPFSLNREGTVAVRIFDVMGRLSGILINNSRLAQGQHFIRFEGQFLPTGSYYMTFDLNGHRVGTKSLLLLK